MAQLQCHLCGAPVRFEEPLGREATCDACGKDLRCCRQCRHYDTRYNNSCRETEADLVEDKERRNFCEYFSFSPEPFAGAARSTSREAEARKRLEQLFGGKPGGVPGASLSDAREKLEGLFKKKREEDEPGGST